ncbi:hypothetical protein MTO96_011809 [Rhipicephalus appendiculatus]
MGKNKRLLEEPEEASPGSAGECRLATASSPAPSSDAPLSPCESRSPSPCRSTVSPAVSTQGEDGASSRDSGAGTSGGGGGGSSSSKTSNNPYAAGLKPRCNSEELVHVDCHLENKDLWDKFHDLGTEMIITKSGSRPALVQDGGPRKRSESGYEPRSWPPINGSLMHRVVYDRSRSPLAAATRRLPESRPPAAADPDGCARRALVTPGTA